MKYELDYKNNRAFTFPNVGDRVWFWRGSDTALSTKVMEVDKEKRTVKLHEFGWQPLSRVSTPRNITTHPSLATHYSEPKFYERQLTYQEIAVHMISKETIAEENNRNGNKIRAKMLVTEIENFPEKSLAIVILDKNILSDISDDPESKFEMLDTDLILIPRSRYKDFVSIPLSEIVDLDTLVSSDWTNPESWGRKLEDG